MIFLEISNTVESTTESITLDLDAQNCGPKTLGRTADKDVCLNELSISRNHGSFSVKQGELVFVDLGSKIGSSLDGIAVEAHQDNVLKVGSSLVIGPFEINIVEIAMMAGGGDTDPDATVVSTSVNLNFQAVANVKSDEWEFWGGENASGKTLARCVNIIDETHDVKTFEFVSKPNTLFRYKPGQFATLHLTIDGQKVNRSYTISSSPSRPHCYSHTIKRVPSSGDHPPGLVSNWLHDNVNVGDQIEVSGPYGVFSCHDFPSKKLCLVSGGSGITPMLSMARWVCDTQSNIEIVFVHAARTEADLIARVELEYLASRYQNFRLLFTLSGESDRSSWSGYRGRMSSSLLYSAVPDLNSWRVFVCGPAPFMASIKEQLRGDGYPMDRYQEESFGAPVASEQKQGSEEKAEKPAEFGLKAALKKISPVKDGGVQNRVSKEDNKKPSALTASVKFSQSGKTIEAKGSSILEAAEENGISLPFGCRAGACGACKQKLLSGKIQRDDYDDQVLSDDERNEGYILCCIGKADGAIEIDA